MNGKSPHDPRPRLSAALLLTCACFAAACSDSGDSDPGAAARPGLEDGLAPPETSAMTAKLERTLLGIDVLDVQVRFGPETTHRLDSLAARASENGDEALGDSVAEAALASTNAYVRVNLLRDVPLDQYLEAVRENLRIASRSGVLPRPELETTSSRMRPWFSFLEGRDLKEGDRLAYRIRGDTVRTLYWGHDGYPFLDQTDPLAADQRRAILGGYLAEGVELREDLVESVFE